MKDPRSESAFTVASPTLRPLPLGQLRPTGWLRGQLHRQREGMGGKLDEFWPDVRDSAWIGGIAEGWERGPYWLDGMVPLAFLLDDLTLQAKVRRWVDYILEHQGVDGWMGPEDGDPSKWHHADYGQYDVWPRMVILKALLQYRNATSDPRIVPAALRLLERIDHVLAQYPLHEWGRVRWADLVLSINELFTLTGEQWLLALAARVRDQGYDWTRFAGELPYKERVPDSMLREFESNADGIRMNDDFLATHGANVAMGVKALPVWWTNTGDDELKASFRRMLAQLDEYHGQATGLFTSDEHLAGLNPSQGTETCTVVEYMFSLETALQVWGVDEAVADRLERIAFNALPASARSDEWAHQYDQQANQVIAHVTEDRIYTDNGPDSNTFGLEPNFGCCTANRHQGWPKFAARLWMQTADNGLAAVSYAPCIIDTELDGKPVHLEVGGQYPFGDDVLISISVPDAGTFPLHLRVPSWVIGARLRVDDEPEQPLRAGTTHIVTRQWHGDHQLSLHWDADVTTQTRPSSGLTVTRGPIVFAAAIDEDWNQIDGELPHATWEVLPASGWNYALVIDEPGSGIRGQLERRTLGDEPFTPDGSPLAIQAQARRVPEWKIEQGAAAAPPASPVAAAPDTEMITLLPYGAARLRVTELPWVLRDAGRMGTRS